MFNCQVLIKSNCPVLCKFFRFGLSLPVFFDGFGESKYILACYVSYTQHSAWTEYIMVRCLSKTTHRSEISNKVIYPKIVGSSLLLLSHLLFSSSFFNSLFSPYLLPSSLSCILFHPFFLVRFLALICFYLWWKEWNVMISYWEKLSKLHNWRKYLSFDVCWNVMWRNSGGFCNVLPYLRAGLC